MKGHDFSETVATLRKEIKLVENRAEQVSAGCQAVCASMELLKAESIKRGLENRRTSLTRQAGIVSVMKNEAKLKVGLGVAVAGLLLSGAMTRDGLSAVNAGMSGLDGVLQGFGESEWAVSLDEDVIIVRQSEIERGRTWVTLPSLLVALDNLKKKLRGGESLANIAAIIARLKNGTMRLVYLFPINQPVRVIKST